MIKGQSINNNKQEEDISSESISTTLKSPRQPGIELLRILCMIGIIMMHFAGANGNGLEFSLNHNLTNSYIFYRGVLLFFCPAVDIFILITGYFMAGKENRSWWKPIKLIFEVIIFRVFLYISSSVVHQSFSLFGLVKSLLPVNYYAILFVVLYVLSHYLDIIYNEKKASWNKFVVLVFFIFSIWTFCLDILSNFANSDINGMNPVGLNGTGGGYTIVNFTLIYIIGGWIKNNKDKIDGIKSWKFIFGFILNLVLMTVWTGIFEQIGKTPHAQDYNNPLVIVNACIFFILFSRLKIKTESLIGKIIDAVAKCVFITFLIHPAFIAVIKTEWIVYENIAITILFTLVMAFIIYIASFIVFFIYNFVESFIEKWLRNVFGSLSIKY